MNEYIGRLNHNIFASQDEQIVYTPEQLAQQRAARERVGTIIVRISNNYGQRAVYPVCETAQKFANLIGTKTFTDRAIAQIKDLGYAIDVEHQSL